MYSGQSRLMTMMMPIELIDRVDAKAKQFGTNRSHFIRLILELMILTPDEYKARAAKENAIKTWIASGADPAKDPEAEWNPDHLNHKTKRRTPRGK